MWRMGRGVRGLVLVQIPLLCLSNPKLGRCTLRFNTFRSAQSDDPQLHGLYHEPAALTVQSDAAGHSRSYPELTAHRSDQTDTIKHRIHPNGVPGGLIGIRPPCRAPSLALAPAIYRHSGRAPGRSVAASALPVGPHLPGLLSGPPLRAPLRVRLPRASAGIDGTDVIYERDRPVT